MLDSIDHKILNIVQKNAKITNLDLAARINLSPTACLGRVKKLENSGVISGYKAEIDPSKAGYSISGLVLMRINNNTKKAATDFSEAVNNSPSIIECHMTAGKIDYIAKVYAKDFQHYEVIVKDELAALPHIASMETLFLFSNLVPDGIFDFAQK